MANQAPVLHSFYITPVTFLGSAQTPHIQKRKFFSIFVWGLKWIHSTFWVINLNTPNFTRKCELEAEMSTFMDYPLQCNKSISYSLMLVLLKLGNCDGQLEKSHPCSREEWTGVSRIQYYSVPLVSALEGIPINRDCPFITPLLYLPVKGLT